MTDEFSLLFDLVERKEVGGRGVATISRELREKLANLARGSCNEHERRELMSLLEKQPELIPALVDEIRALRESSK